MEKRDEHWRWTQGASKSANSLGLPVSIHCTCEAEAVAESASIAPCVLADASFTHALHPDHRQERGGQQCPLQPPQSNQIHVTQDCDKDVFTQTKELATRCC